MREACQHAPQNHQFRARLVVLIGNRTNNSLLEFASEIELTLYPNVQITCVIGVYVGDD